MKELSTDLELENIRVRYHNLEAEASRLMKELILEIETEECKHRMENKVLKELKSISIQKFKELVERKYAND